MKKVKFLESKSDWILTETNLKKAKDLKNTENYTLTEVINVVGTYVARSSNNRENIIWSFYTEDDIIKLAEDNNSEIYKLSGYEKQVFFDAVITSERCLDLIKAIDISDENLYMLQNSIMQSNLAFTILYNLASKNTDISYIKIIRSFTNKYVNDALQYQYSGVEGSAADALYLEKLNRIFIRNKLKTVSYISKNVKTSMFDVYNSSHDRLKRFIKSRVNYWGNEFIEEVGGLDNFNTLLIKYFNDEYTKSNKYANFQSDMDHVSRAFKYIDAELDLNITELSDTVQEMMLQYRLD